MKISGSRITSFLQKPSPDIIGILLFGPEQGLIKERSQMLAQTIVENFNDPFRVSSFSGNELKANPPLLSDQAAQLSLTGGKRIILVSDAGDNISKIFENYLNESNSNNLVIAESGSLTPRSSLRKLFENSKNGAAIGCYEDDNNTLLSVIKETLGSFNLSVSNDASAYLLSNLGSNRLLTRGELEKLALYVSEQSDKNNVISITDAMACIGDSAAISLDLIVYAATSGNMQILDKLIVKAFNDGTQPVGILRAIQRHLQNLHFVIGKIETGMTQEKALALIRPPIMFKFKKQFQSQIRQWKKDSLFKALDLVTEAEIGCKSNGFPANAGCHRALMRVAQAARIQK